QKKLVLSRGDVPEDKMRVVKNGFNPQLFQYAGPENRNWKRLMYAGRLEMSKGIHVLLAAFQKLKAEFPDLELSVYGDRTSWPDLDRRCDSLERELPGLKFFGKVPQQEIALALRSAGIFVFPSVSFESAGLGVLDAQAAGCPVVANAVGGVPEYLVDGYCGLLIRDKEPSKLEEMLTILLRDPARLMRMSQDCFRFGRSQTWDHVAQELLDLAQHSPRSLGKGNDTRKLSTEIIETHAEFQRSWLRTGISVHQLLEDHEIIASGQLVSDETLVKIVESEPDLAVVYLWLGLRSEHDKVYERAKEYFQKAYALGKERDWQSLFRLVLLDAEQGRVVEAAGNASRLLKLVPEFPLRSNLERLASMESQVTEGRS
ncbi:MAG: glycosyltransferase family 4 protein, partial [Bdellovibrionales bacterium]|nr:glycosyltransferase family 4 protein [Bdellovibrionales bacterium]